MRETWYVKLSLHCEGVRITQRAKKQIPQTCVGDRVTTNGIQTAFWTNGNSKQWVTVRENVESSNVLDYKNGGFVFRVGGKEFKCHVYPNREFRGVGWQHTDRIRISPVKGCSCVCSYCNEYTREYELRGADTILGAIDDALQWENPPHHCLISGGTPRPDDYDRFDDLLIEISHQSPIPVEVMIGAREDPNFLKRLRKSGNFSGVKMNLEFFDKDDSPIWKRLIPTKHVLGLNTRLLNIEMMRELWDVEVSSLIIVGVDIVPVKYVLDGVRWLAERGISPVLSPFIPGIGTPLEKYRSPTVDELVSIYQQAESIADRYGVMLGPKCGPCQHNTLTFS